VAEVLVFVLIGEKSIEGSAIARYTLLTAAGCAAIAPTTLLCLDFEPPAIREVECILGELHPSSIEVRFLSAEGARAWALAHPGYRYISHDFPNTLRTLRSLPFPADQVDLFVSAVAPPWINTFRVRTELKSEQPWINHDAASRLSANSVQTVIARVRSFGYRRSLRVARAVIALSTCEATFLSEVLGVTNTFTALPAVDPRFRYQSPKGNHAVAIVPKMLNRFVARQIERISLAAGCESLHLLGESSVAVTRLFKDIRAQAFGFVSQHDFVADVSSARIALTTDPRGAFEMAPIEVLRSGTPLAGPLVPSLVELLMKLDGSTIHGMPFWPIATSRFEAPVDLRNFPSWLDTAERRSGTLSDLVASIFSLHNAGAQILRGIRSFSATPNLQT